jgi:hypothetical protein
MLDFLATLHKYDDKKVQEAREAMLKPGSIYRRREFKAMDADIKGITGAPLNTDAEIVTFMEAISLFLRRVNKQLVDPEGQGLKRKIYFKIYKMPRRASGAGR